ncbi:hypothetical protein BLJAPNOD_02948 [Ensifer sp. M14]|uniref:hypothetical protein n=1 Tax=Ensifer sp. M14 TaxID=2203782 RepID=UPI000E1D01CE|nr:hypothetical protein [Ensifer sp. M14]RDL51807.1 hypothetical protein BLJAPNOD_02948 [Ensifer sp. M14]
MKIKMLVGLAGNEYSLAPGDERDFPDGEANRLIVAGYAVPAVAEKAERAVVQPVTERRTKKGKADVVSSEGDNSADG